MTDAPLPRPFMLEAAGCDTAALLSEWRWRVPSCDTPLQLTALGDWLFGAPDGSLRVLSLLDGSYRRVAADAREYTTRLRSRQWLDEVFLLEWFEIGLGAGWRPTRDECLGWRVHAARRALRSRQPAVLRHARLSIPHGPVAPAMPAAGMKRISR